GLLVSFLVSCGLVGVEVTGVEAADVDAACPSEASIRPVFFSGNAGITSQTVDCGISVLSGYSLPKVVPSRELTGDIRKLFVGFPRPSKFDWLGTHFLRYLSILGTD